MTIGEKIIALCKDSHINQKTLADAIGYTQSTMTRWVKDEREMKVGALVKIAEYFGVSTDYLLGLSDARSYNGFVSGDDALEYCRKAKDVAWECWHDAAKFNAAETPVSLMADNVRACAYFEREILRWEYDIPRMIHSLVDGTWKDHFKEEQDEES